MSLFEFPTLAAPVLDFIRSASGALLIGTLLLTLPHARRFLLSERWGGYGESCRFVDIIQNPFVLPVVLAVWLGCGVCLVLGQAVVLAAFVNLLLCRYFFLHMRWKGVLRGMGAPGFLTCWLAGAVFLLEFARHHAPPLLPLAILVLQVDFALIMFVAGWYKLCAGYASGEGMEFGLVNPEWGYWWRLYRRIPPAHPFFWFNNQMAWMGEIVAGILMLIPATRFWGGLFMLLSFVYIACNIRLLLLAPMVMVACVLFFGPDTPGETVILALKQAPVAYAPGSPNWIMPDAALASLEIALWVFLASLPIAYAGLFWNFYFRRRLPGRLQIVLERWTNFFGMILWRVFSADVTHFFIRIHRQPRDGGPRTLVSNWGLRGGLRYSHVGEAITVTSIFTTLKYFASNRALFEQRLLRYARTVPCPADCVLVFEYVHIRKDRDCFQYDPVAEFHVDLAASSIEERILDESFSASTPMPRSPVHEGRRPGSYVPLGK